MKNKNIFILPLLCLLVLLIFLLLRHSYFTDTKEFNVAPSTNFVVPLKAGNQSLPDPVIEKITRDTDINVQSYKDGTLKYKTGNKGSITLATPDTTKIQYSLVNTDANYIGKGFFNIPGPLTECITDDDVNVRGTTISGLAQHACNVNDYNYDLTKPGIACTNGYNTNGYKYTCDTEFDIYIKLPPMDTESLFKTTGPASNNSSETGLLYSQYDKYGNFVKHTALNSGSDNTVKMNHLGYGLFKIFFKTTITSPIYSFIYYFGNSYKGTPNTYSNTYSKVYALTKLTLSYINTFPTSQIKNFNTSNPYLDSTLDYFWNSISKTNNIINSNNILVSFMFYTFLFLPEGAYPTSIDKRINDEWASTKKNTVVAPFGYFEVYTPDREFISSNILNIRFITQDGTYLKNYYPKEYHLQYTSPNYNDINDITGGYLTSTYIPLGGYMLIPKFATGNPPFSEFRIFSFFSNVLNRDQPPLSSMIKTVWLVRTEVRDHSNQTLSLIATNKKVYVNVW